MNPIVLMFGRHFAEFFTRLGRFSDMASFWLAVFRLDTPIRFDTAVESSRRP